MAIPNATSRWQKGKRGNPDFSLPPSGHWELYQWSQAAPWLTADYTKQPSFFSLKKTKLLGSLESFVLAVCSQVSQGNSYS